MPGLHRQRSLNLQSILDYHQDLYAANKLKGLLPEVYHTPSKEEVGKLWDEWVTLANQSEIEGTRKFAVNQDRNYREGITNSGLYHIRTNVLKGINNKIKVLKRVAYGFRELDFFFLRMKSIFKGKAVLL